MSRDTTAATAASAAARRERLLQRYAETLRAAGFTVLDRRPHAPTEIDAANALNDLNPISDHEAQRMLGWIVGASPQAIVSAAKYIQDLRDSAGINA